MVPEDASNSSDQEAGSALDRSYVEIVDVPDEIETGIPIVWGRFWGSDEVASSAFFLEINPRSLLDEDESPISSFQLAVFGDEANIREYDPSQGAEQFKNKVINFNIADVTIPKLTMKEQGRELEKHLTSSKVNWLNQFIENEDYNQLERWVDQWFGDAFPDTQLEYQVRASIVEETMVDEEEESTDNEPQEQHADLRERDHDLGENEENNTEQEDRKSLDISVVTSPANGIKVPELQVGMDILVRIIGDAVRFLPEDLVESGRSSPSSIPIETNIIDIQEDPVLPELYDADPRKYRKIVVELEEGILGEGIVHQEELVKKPGMEEKNTTDQSYDEILYFVLAMVALIGVLLLVIQL